MEQQFEEKRLSFDGNSSAPLSNTTQPLRLVEMAACICLGREFTSAFANVHKEMFLALALVG